MNQWGSDRDIQCCNQEEADTKICVHVYDALQNWARKILVTTVDTYVVVLLVSIIYFQLHSQFPDFSVWVGFGTGNHFRYYDIGLICQSLGDEKSRTLLFFHAFIVCDTTSKFLGKGKVCLGVLEAYPDVLEAFFLAADYPFHMFQFDSSQMKLLEWYVLYYRIGLVHCVQLMS